ncbi:MAG: hypothetical protein WD334_03505 [Chitinophagales bacterium]
MKLKAFSLFLMIVLNFSVIVEPLYAAPQKEKKKKMKKSEMREAIADYEEEIEKLNSEVQELRSENDNLNQELTEARQKNVEMEARMQKVMAEAQPYLSDRMPTEVYFKVQLGAYKELDIQESFNKAKTLQTETESDGIKKYTVGEFKTLDSAKKFELDLRKLGIGDAWLVPYKNNRRISDEQASEAVGRDIRQ